MVEVSKVDDLTRALSGPFCLLVLASSGEEVETECHPRPAAFRSGAGIEQ